MLARRGELRQAAPQSIKMSNYKVIGGNQREYGPVSADEVRQWIGDGRLNARSLVQAGDGTEWKPLGTLSEFADALRQPAAPPPINAAPVSPTDWAHQVLAREPDLRVGECLRGGLSFFAANAGFVIGVVLISWSLNLISLIPIIGGILHLLFGGVVTGGLYLACLRRMRGQPASISSVFDGFRLCFVQLMLVGAISGLLAELSVFLCVLPWFYLTVAWTFAVPLVADKRLEFWPAMELSRKTVARVWFPMLVLLFITFLPVLVAQVYSGIKIGGLFLQLFADANHDFLRFAQSLQHHMGEIVAVSLKIAVVTHVTLLLNLYYAMGVLVHAYESLFGNRKS